MNDVLHKATDIRQSPQWGAYLESIGWIRKRVGKTQMFIRTIPFLGGSIIKIQHAHGPLQFSEIDTIARFHKALAVIIEPHVAGYDACDYLKNGYQESTMRYAPSATIKIDLTSSLETIMRSFSENARRNIKKAQNNKLTIKTVFLLDEKKDNSFNEYYELLMHLRKMKNFYAPGYRESYKKMLALKDSSLLMFAYEKKGEKPIAVVWYGYHDTVMTYLQTGITTRGYEYLANYLLVWEGLCLAKKMKLKVFDFESIYDPRYKRDNRAWRGYSEFKKRFHGTIIYYPPSWIKFYSMPFNVLYKIGGLFPI